MLLFRLSLSYEGGCFGFRGLGFTELFYGALSSLALHSTVYRTLKVFLTNGVVWPGWDELMNTCWDMALLLHP